jgi:phage terminase large subunit-like protein
LIGTPFVVTPACVEDLNLILEVDKHGHPVFREVLYGVPRGNGKSPIAAGLGLFDLARMRDKPEIYIGSGAREQAGIIGEYGREMAANGPLKDWTRPVIGGVRWTGPGGGVMRTVSADGGLQHGKYPFRMDLDELHVFTTTKQVMLHEAFQSTLHKRPDSQLLATSTAGFDLVTLLGEWYLAMLKAPSVERTGPLGSRLVCIDRAAGRLMIWWGAADGADAENPAVWRAANPAPWLWPQLDGAARRYPRSTFERLVLNRWTASSDSSIRPDAWDACSVADLERGADVVLAWSASPRRDQAALVAVSTIGERVAIRRVKGWADVDQGVIEAELAEAVGEEIRSGAVQCFAADPLQLPEAYEAVRALGVSEWRGARANRPGMPQTPAFMEPATSEFVAGIESGRVAHDGDVELRRMVLRAEAADTRRGWMLARPKRSGERKPESVEGAMAAAMGVYAASVKRSAPQFEVWD